ncbi:MFS transporter [Purpureocillium lilacinum]|uniref:MFS transporter n=1 Tax=Purpureocillium lilacinum TaxID=33203 RepID=A0A179GC91_PURLI|nr:MFS transporter [Purpureocillium lilacinum]OAQ75031.1 MFS transporter [Purpureocillium lilacinum]
MIGHEANLRQDQTIIATAIPTITSQFHSIEDIGWYGSAYLLTTCSFQLFFGKLYTLLSLKWTFVGAVVVFEVGSAICGASPNSIALIVGRAIAGIGGAGVFSGALIIIAKSVPLAKRPAFTGILGAVWGVASVVGPLLGVNLPVGAVAIPFIIFFLRSSSDRTDLSPNWKSILLQFDPIGTVLFVAGIICLLIGLQWGGSEYSWSNAREITLMTLFGVLMIAWGITQHKMSENATVPLRIARQRTVAFSTFYIFFGSACFVLVIYYLPIWYATHAPINNDSAAESGIHNLPAVLSVGKKWVTLVECANQIALTGTLVVFAIAGGLGVTAVGYYTPFMIAGAMVLTVGAGLLMLGFQIIFGAGAGLGLELPNIAVQTVLPEKDVSIGTSLVVFARSLGGSIFVSAGQNVFNNHIISGMREQVPDLDPSVVLQAGATELQATVQDAATGQADIMRRVLNVYNDAIVQTFVLALALAAVSILGSLGVEWRSVKKPATPTKSQGDKK